MRLCVFAVFVLAVSAGVAPNAGQQPSLSGTWTLDGFMGRAPLGFRDERAICPLPSGGADSVEPGRHGGPSTEAGDVEGVEQVTSIGTFEAELAISQSPAEIAVDRRYSGSIGTSSHRDVFKLDGTESVSTVGKVTSRTKSRWEGAALVVDHHLTWGPTQNSSCRVRETFTLDAGGALSIVAINEHPAGSWSSRQTYIRKVR